VISIFLSASIPLPHRNPRYAETADVVAIRDSIRALVNIVVPVGKIVFGGHPAITPLIRQLIRQMKRPVRQHVILYQSRYFEAEFPPETEEFEEVRLIEAVDDNRDASLVQLRIAMLRSEDFHAAVFIGGMEGVEEEYKMFQEFHPGKPTHPIASTGAAALDLFDQYATDRRALRDNLLYLSLFRELLELPGE
jgi:hypothetical protein